MQPNQWILDEVDHARESGIKVDVDGIVYNRKSSANLSKVLEKGSYMLDYEGDPTGHIVALHIDSVGPSEQPSYKSLRCINKERRPERKRRNEKK